MDRTSVIPLDGAVTLLPKGSVAPLLAQLEAQFSGISSSLALPDERSAAGLLWDVDPVGGDETVVQKETRVSISPSIAKFIKSRADVVLLMSSRGEGKSTGAVIRLLDLANDYPDEVLPLRVSAVRDTWTNISRTTIPTIEHGHRMGWWQAEFLEGRTQCRLNGGLVHIFFWGMDSDRDSNKFQSFECGVLWLEEPAPAADLMSGIPVSVLAMGASSLRQPGITHPCIQITENPPDDDHWSITLAEELQEMGRSDMRIEVIRVPPGENRHLPAGYRERMRVLLEGAGRQDLVRRLVEGQVGSVKLGEPVTPEFSKEHIAPGPIKINLRFETFRFWDAGLNPTCIWAQRTPDGGINILGCIVGVNMGIEELIELHVIPWEVLYGLRKTLGPSAIDPYGHIKPSLDRTRQFRIRDIGDPAFFQRDQSSSERSAGRSLENLLRTQLERGPIPWARGRDSVKVVLTRMIRGRPMLLIDPEARPLIKALEGGCRYHRAPSGKISNECIKDINSHPFDALRYGLGLLFPVDDITEPATTPRALRDGAPPPESFMGV